MLNDASLEIKKINLSIVPEILSAGSAESPKIVLTRPYEYYLLDDFEKEMYCLPKAKTYTNSKNNRKTLTRRKNNNVANLADFDAVSPKVAEVNPNMQIKNPNNIKFSDMMDRFIYKD